MQGDEREFNVVFSYYRLHSRQIGSHQGSQHTLICLYTYKNKTIRLLHYMEIFLKHYKQLKI